MRGRRRIKKEVLELVAEIVGDLIKQKQLTDIPGILKHFNLCDIARLIGVKQRRIIYINKDWNKMRTEERAIFARKLRIPVRKIDEIIAAK
jgi:hypothetical protein